MARRGVGTQTGVGGDCPPHACSGLGHREEEARTAGRGPCSRQHRDEGPVPPAREAPALRGRSQRGWEADSSPSAPDLPREADGDHLPPPGLRPDLSSPGPSLLGLLLAALRCISCLPPMAHGPRPVTGSRRQRCRWQHLEGEWRRAWALWAPFALEVLCSGLLCLVLEGGGFPEGSATGGSWQCEQTWGSGRCERERLGTPADEGPGTGCQDQWGGNVDLEVDLQEWWSDRAPHLPTCCPSLRKCPPE